MSATVKKPTSTGGTALASGGLAAILASACCVAPLALVSVGIGGVWMGLLTRLTPYQPIFIGIAVVALFFAYRPIFRPLDACEPAAVCAIPATRSTYRILFWVVATLLAVAAIFPYLAPLFY